MGDTAILLHGTVTENGAEQSALRHQWNIWSFVQYARYRWAVIHCLSFPPKLLSFFLPHNSAPVIGCEVPYTLFSRTGSLSPFTCYCFGIAQRCDGPTLQCLSVTSVVLNKCCTCSAESVTEIIWKMGTAPFWLVLCRDDICVKVWGSWCFCSYFLCSSTWVYTL